jgi:hypothetical protein
MAAIRSLRGDHMGKASKTKAARREKEIDKVLSTDMSDIDLSNPKVQEMLNKELGDAQRRRLGGASESAPAQDSPTTMLAFIVVIVLVLVGVAFLLR